LRKLPVCTADGLRSLPYGFCYFFRLEIYNAAISFLDLCNKAFDFLISSEPAAAFLAFPSSAVRIAFTLSLVYNPRSLMLAKGAFDIITKFKRFFIEN
jgi:hypothetical protein